MNDTLFTSALAPSAAANCAGFGAGGCIDPSKWADQMFKGKVPGPWLLAYMIRRFGWPNTGSDPDKNLCSWMLTTPIPGLYLGVTPYLGDGSNLHFSVYFNRAIDLRLRSDPGRALFAARREKAIRRWWNQKGRRFYTLGAGMKEGDPDELIELHSERGDKVYGLWRRTPAHTWSNALPRKDPGMLLWWLGEFIIEKHPEVVLPKMSKREQAWRMSRFHIQARVAIKATLRDLLRPTSVRDISFTAFGDIERTPEAVARYRQQATASRFEGAGYTPAAWINRPRCAHCAKVTRAPGRGLA